MPPRNRKMTIEIENLTVAQVIAIEDLMATWRFLGSVGSSRWTSFFADGDGDFRPKITVNGLKPQTTNLYPRSQFWVGDEYKIDFDCIAAALDKEGIHGIP
jgi:hypothetical protein